MFSGRAARRLDALGRSFAALRSMHASYQLHAAAAAPSQLTMRPHLKASPQLKRQLSPLPRRPLLKQRRVGRRGSAGAAACTIIWTGYFSGTRSRGPRLRSCRCGPACVLRGTEFGGLVELQHVAGGSQRAKREADCLHACGLRSPNR